MSLSNLRAFERLLASGASISDVDDFPDALKSQPAEGYTQRLLQNFSRKDGFVRDQLQFLRDLYTNGIYIDRQTESRTAFVFFSGVLDSAAAAGMRWRMSKMEANCIYLYDNELLNFSFGVRGRFEMG